MLSDVFVRILRGPVGSAKSSTCVMEMFRRICDQRPNVEGVRKSRWAVIRNTNPQLRTTTIKTYEDWLPPEHFGAIKMAPPPFVHEIVMQLPDGTSIESEVIFLSLDSPEDMRKLLSLELTGAFINEAREISKTIVDGVTQRLRRYPSMRDGGASWSGLIMDTNAPDDDHWLAIMSGDAPPPEGMSDDEVLSLVKPTGWEFFTQPAAMLEIFEGKKLVGYEVNPQAENIQNLDPLYYAGMIAGKMKAWIDVYILNRYGATHDGRAVQAAFRRDVHVAPQPLDYVPNLGIWIGVDFGLTPAAIFAQQVRGKWQVLREVVLVDAGAVQLAAAINRTMASDFPGEKIRVCWGDPAGDQRAGTDKVTPFQVLRAANIPARPTETNDVEIRRIAGDAPLGRLDQGEPSIVFDPRCKVLVTGLEGAWCYKRVRGAEGTFEDEPQKNRYSHPCEAWEYLMLGGGEARAAIGRKAHGANKTAIARPRSDPMDRFRRERIKRDAGLGARRY